MIRVVILTLLFSGCAYVSSDEHEMGRYPEIERFILAEDKVQTKHFIDAGVKEFYFQTNFQDYFVYTDSVALVNSWDKIEESKSRRIYTKLLKSYPADESIDTLVISIDDQIRNIKLVWK